MIPPKPFWLKQPTFYKLILWISYFWSLPVSYSITSTHFLLCSQKAFNKNRFECIILSYHQNEPKSKTTMNIMIAVIKKSNFSSWLSIYHSCAIQPWGKHLNSLCLNFPVLKWINDCFAIHFSENKWHPIHSFYIVMKSKLQVSALCEALAKFYQAG